MAVAECPSCHAVNPVDYKKNGLRPVVYTQTYEPTDKRGAPYIQGRCRACGYQWDVQTGQEDPIR